MDTKKKLEDAIMDLVELLGSHPAECKQIDPRAWAHLFTYSEPFRDLFKAADDLRMNFPMYAHPAASFVAPRLPIAQCNELVDAVTAIYQAKR